MIQKTNKANKNRTVIEKEFSYEMKNNSAIYKKYIDVLDKFKNNKAKLKPFMSSEYFDMCEETEYIEKVKEVYQEFYEYK